jgi:manganese efflux pump family protein
MSLLAIIISAFALAMDAFAVSLAIGLGDHAHAKTNAVKCGVAFGVFQTLMTAIGWFVGLAFMVYIKPIDHYIAFILLAFIGVKMIYESFDVEKEKKLTGLKMLLVLALATSIDAMAAGLSFSSISTGDINIFQVAILIGVISLILSYIGVRLGNILRSVKTLERYADILGGVVLIAMGLKVLIDHLMQGI